MNGPQTNKIPSDNAVASNSNKTTPWDAIDLAAHGFIEASAGTGKTYTIEQLVVRILSRPQDNPWNRLVNLDEILIVTYTEKAAAELRSRIRTILEKTLADITSEKTGIIREHVGKCLMEFDRAEIHTIHGFCNRSLAAYAFESGRTVDTEVRDSSEDSAYAARHVIRNHAAAMEASSQGSFGRMLSAVNMNADNLEKLVANLAASCDPYNNDCILPDVPAADFLDVHKEFRSRFGCANPAGHTFVKNFNADSLKAGLSLGRKPNQPFIDKRLETMGLLMSIPPADSPDSFLAWAAQNNVFPGQDLEDWFTVASRGPTELSGVLGTVNGSSFADFVKMANRLRTLALHAMYKPVLDMANRTREMLEDSTERAGVLTYDSMIKYMHEAVAGNKNTSSSPLLPVLRKKFRYGIIDEFQDTNRIQWEIFRAIFIDMGNTRPAAEKGYLYVVGDPKQSIFSFQGSDLAAYYAALKDIRPKEGSAGVTLGVNFRSGPAMVSAYNAIFSMENWFADPKNESLSPVYRPVVSGLKEGADNPENPTESAILLRRLYNSNDARDFSKDEKSYALALWIVSWIKILTGSNRLNGDDNSAKEEVTPKISLSDICVLVETHSEAVPLMRLLRKHKIPYTKQRNRGLFLSNECLHLLTVLDSVDRAGDSAAFKKALLTMFFNVPAQALNGNADFSGREWRGITDLFAKLYRLANRCEWGKLFGTLYRETDIESKAMAQEENLLCRAAYAQLKTYCLRKLIDENMSLRRFVKKLRSLNNGTITEKEEEDIFNRETDRDAVSILTIFSAKGLEFPAVFLACGGGEGLRTKPYFEVRNKSGGTDFILTHSDGKQRFEEQRDMEQRRLYYVALTRAKTRLFVPVWDNPAMAQKKNSASARFLSECCEKAFTAAKNQLLIDVDEKDIDCPINGSMTVDTIPSVSGPVSVTPPESVPEWPGASPRDRSTIRLSYTGIVRLADRFPVRTEGGNDELHEEKLTPAQTENLKAEILAPGAKSGEALHAILENADFARWAGYDSVAGAIEDRECRNAVEQALVRNAMLMDDGRSEEKINKAAEYVYNCITIPFKDPHPCGKQPIVLADINSQDRLSEAEFHFVFSKNSGLFEGSNPDGWVKGFIDMLFVHEDRYYLLDWKSNWLPNQNYSATAIQASMTRHRYDVQYMVYSCAMHRWLGDILKNDYDPGVHFGGVIYVYMRGRDKQNPESGIWAQCPTLYQLEKEWPAVLKKQISDAAGYINLGKN
jgi:exodeoxyribonuclease V beta subunit